MLKTLILIILYASLCGCMGSIQHNKKFVYRCSYRNTTTKKMYIFDDHDHFIALHKAQKACKKDPVDWCCYFDTCTEMMTLN